MFLCVGTLRATFSFDVGMQRAALISVVSNNTTKIQN